MMYLVINQKAVIESGLNLSISHLAVLEKLKAIPLHSEYSMKDELGKWYRTSMSEILNDLPILQIKEQQCRKLVNRLIECDLIEANPRNKQLNFFYFRFGIDINLI